MYKFIFFFLLIFTNLFAAEECSGDKATSVPDCMKKCEKDTDCTLITKECYNFPVNENYKASASLIIDKLKLVQCIDSIPNECKFSNCISNKCVFLQKNCFPNVNNSNKNFVSPMKFEGAKEIGRPNEVSSNFVTPITQMSGVRKILSSYLELLNDQKTKSNSQKLFIEKLNSEKDYILLLINSKLSDKEILNSVFTNKKDNTYFKSHIAISAKRYIQFDSHDAALIKAQILIALDELNKNELISILETPYFYSQNIITYQDENPIDINIDSINFKSKDIKIIAFIISKESERKNFNMSEKDKVDLKNDSDLVFYFNDVFINPSPVYKNLLRESNVEYLAFSKIDYLVSKKLINLLDVWKKGRDLFGLNFDRFGFYNPGVKIENIKKYILDNVDEFVLSAKSEQEACRMINVVQYDFTKYLDNKLKDKIKKIQPFKYDCLKFFSKILENKKELLISECNVELYQRNSFVIMDYTEVPLNNCSRSCESDLDCTNLVPGSCLSIPVNKKFSNKVTEVKGIISEPNLCKEFSEENHLYECKEKVCELKENLFAEQLVKYIGDKEEKDSISLPGVLTCEFDYECRNLSIVKKGSTANIAIGSSENANNFAFSIMTKYKIKGIETYIRDGFNKGNNNLCIQGLCKRIVP